MNKRNCKIEVLRVVAMFMVLMLHSNGHGGGIAQYEFGTCGYYLFWLSESFCMVAVNSFVLITGYYGTKSTFRLSKVVRFYLEVAIFSVLCTAITFTVDKTKVGSYDWLYSILPLTSKRYWFASNYALLLLIQPFLNLFIAILDKKKHKSCIFESVLLYSVIPTFFIWNREITGTGMDIIWFVILYFVGSYIGKYGLKIGRCKWIGYYLLFTGGLFISNVVIPYASKVITGTTLGIGVFYYYNTLPVFLASVCFFMIFANQGVSRPETNSKNILFVISKLGMFAFGAYLISDHRVIRQTLWEKINITGISQNPFVVFIYMLFVNICLLLIGIVVDMAVKQIINRLPIESIMKIINRRAKSIKLDTRG